MRDDDKKRDDDAERREAFELTAAEKKALEMLPRELLPNAALEDRLVGELRARGILAPPRRRLVEVTTRRLVSVAAACLALLIAGFALGQWMDLHQVPGGGLTGPETSDISVAAELQQTGSAYLLALQRLAELPDTVDADLAVQGREVALTTLYAAADQVSRLVPKRELAGQLLFAIDNDLATRTIGWHGGAVIGGSQVIEF